MIDSHSSRPARPARPALSVPPPAPVIPLAPGLEALAARYDGLLCDVWGVLHNGVRAHACAATALTRYREGGGTVVLLSNAPRPAQDVRASLVRLGIPPDLCGDLITSGEAALTALRGGQHGAACHHVGPRQDLTLLDGAPLRLTPPEEADFVLCTGLVDDDAEGPEDYRAALERLAQLGLVMLCINPDRVIERDGRLVYCAGALAALYEQLGGDVIYFGKPHAPIYDHALAVMDARAGRKLDRRRVLAVGDGMATDIAGAAAAGLDALFITGGIAAAEVGGDPLRPVPARVNALCAAHGLAPVAAMARLCWTASPASGTSAP